MSIMKMNWGTRIAMVYIGFVILMVTLVTMSMKQDFQLVSKDYYQKEITYQEVMDAGKSQSLLSQPVSFIVNEAMIGFGFPNEFIGKNINGTIEFYAAANSKWDAKFDFVSEDNQFKIIRNKLFPTRYQVKINWEMDGIKYYQESLLNLN